MTYAVRKEIVWRARNALESKYPDKALAKGVKTFGSMFADRRTGPRSPCWPAGRPVVPNQGGTDRALHVYSRLGGRQLLCLPEQPCHLVRRSVDAQPDHEESGTKRIVWFERKGAAPSFNHAWYIWDWEHRGFPTIAYYPVTSPGPVLA